MVTIPFVKILYLTKENLAPLAPVQKRINKHNAKELYQNERRTTADNAGTPPVTGQSKNILLGIINNKKQYNF
ncbi:hypothetical protein XS74_14580 [Salmonella enterica subsp. enterica]|nr:hypothetical protein [Salmonella enterica subsp. salamae]ECF7066881.1 hypothetical protein [Salmonella enterica subsp. enterica]